MTYPERRSADKADAEARRTNRADVAALAVEVGRMNANVEDLAGLLHDSMVKAEQAHQAAEANPSRRLVYALVGFVIFLLAATTLAGVLVLHQENANAHALRTAQYQACMVRNQAQSKSNLYLARINEAVQRAQIKGSILAKELDNLLADGQNPTPLVNCDIYRG